MSSGQFSGRARGAVWDVDGTLVDTAELHFQAWVRFMAEEGRPYTRADFVRGFGRRNPEILPELFGEELAEERMREMAERKERYYREVARSGLELLPGAAGMIDALESAGWRQAIGSSGPAVNVALILELTGVAPKMAAVVTGDDTARGKPDPDVFLLAAERIGVAPADCVVFEDAVVGVQAARAAGMTCVGVTHCGHSTPEALRAAGAHRVVESLTALTAADVAALIVRSRD